MITFKKTPGATAFQRTLMITDALMFNINKDGSTGNPVNVLRHGLRGTQNLVSLKDTSPSNIQMTETAKLEPDAIGLRVETDLRFLPLNTSLSICAPGSGENTEDIYNFKESIVNFTARAIKSEGIVEVASRYVRNIVNGKWLWRNRTNAEKLMITVELNNETYVFDALSIPLNRFEQYSDNEKILANHIVRCFSGESTARLKVTADVDFGVEGALEVHPSENYLAEKPDNITRSLYKYDIQKNQDKSNISVSGFAAIRDQKIGNALRTFDNWYAGYEERQLVIPVEPNGASLEAQEFFRKNTKESSFCLFLKLNEIDPNTAEGMFCIANLIRGGVYSGGKAEATPKKTESNSSAKAANVE